MALKPVRPARAIVSLRRVRAGSICSAMPVTVNALRNARAERRGACPASAMTRGPARCPRRWAAGLHFRLPQPRRHLRRRRDDPYLGEVYVGFRGSQRPTFIRHCDGTAPRKTALEGDTPPTISAARWHYCDGASLRYESGRRGTAGRSRTSAERGCWRAAAMRCRNDRSRDLTEATLLGDVRGWGCIQETLADSLSVQRTAKLRAGPARALRKQGA